MNPEIKPLARALTYAGALPFAACALAVWANAGPLGIAPLVVLKIYSLVIAAFMAGTVWGYVIAQPRGGAALLLLSNGVALVVAGAALAPSPRVTLGVDLAAFAVLLAADARARRQGYIAADYLSLRMRVTAIVAASLAAAWTAA